MELIIWCIAKYFQFFSSQFHEKSYSNPLKANKLAEYISKTLQAGQVEGVRYLHPTYREMPAIQDVHKLR